MGALNKFLAGMILLPALTIASQPASTPVAYQWHTFFGGDAGVGNNRPATVVDAYGNLYVTGETLFPWDAIGNPGPQLPYWESYLTKISPTGQLLGSQFYVTSPAGEGPTAITLDPSGNVYLAGLAKGDVILELNGTPVGDSDELRLKISMMQPNASVKLKFLRDRQERELTATLGESPVKPEGETSAVGPATAGPHLGMPVEQLTPQIARQLNLPPETTGVVVTDVTAGSPAQEAGVRRGDLIQEVDRKPITTVVQFQRAIQQAGNQAVLLLINREGQHLYTVVPAQ